MDINDLGNLVLKKRGNMGVRAAAKEIGISPTTLTRVEKGGVPDVGTLNKITTWLGEDPAQFTGVGDLQIAFKSNKAIPQSTARALANLIDEASKQFSDIESVSH